MEYLKREVPNFNSLDKHNFSLLHLAVDSPYQEMVEYLLSLPETNVNAKNKSNGTPLDTVINSFINPNKIKTIQMLLAHGANINVIGYQGNTPLDEAEENGNQEIIQLLKSKCAKRSSELKK